MWRGKVETFFLSLSFHFIPKDNKVAKGAKTSEFGAFFL